MSESLSLSNIISVNTFVNEPCPPLTLRGFIKSVLYMMGGTRLNDERHAFKSLGGMGFSARRKVRRVRIWADAVAIAAEVGHGGEELPVVVHPDIIMVPISCAAEAKAIFGGN